MNYIKKFNENIENKPKLRDLIGDIKDTKKVSILQFGRTREIIIYETTKGCFSNLENLEIYLDGEYNIYKYNNHTNTNENQQVGDISITKSDGNGVYLYVYLEDDAPQIISTFPGDERNCAIFNGTFISSGHDGNYFWNIKTKEFGLNTW